jgi:hypothetical protein
MKSPRLLPFAALTILALAAPLRADPVAWSYSWSPTNDTLDFGSKSSKGSISLSSLPMQDAFGNSNIIASYIDLKSNAKVLHPIKLGVSDGGYQLNLTIKDTASGKSGTLNFTGQFQGSFSSKSANLTNSFTGLTTQSMSLGGDTYTVTIGPYVPPGPPGPKSSGVIGAYVSVVGAGGNPTPSSTSPEPSSLLLCSLGAAGFAAAGWRRRRQGARVSR